VGKILPQKKQSYSSEMGEGISRGRSPRSSPQASSSEYIRRSSSIMATSPHHQII